MKKENVHDGHRDRLKKRFLNNGLESFEEHEILELLLFFAIPRRDTNKLAHMLLKKFGTLSDVLDAQEDELKKVDGIGENCVTLLKIIPQLCQKYMKSKFFAKRMNLSTTHSMMEFSRSLFVGKKHEEFYVVCMDAQSKLLTYRKISEGTLNSTTFDMRKLVSTVINYNASRVFITHNHPSGTSLPSGADIEATQKIFIVLSSLGVVCDDHIIIATEDMTSFASSGLMKSIEYKIINEKDINPDNKKNK